MNKFTAISIFTKVVEQGGFTAAARKLGVSVSAVTKTVARLEDDLGIQLFNRTTRQIVTTDYGGEFYLRCIRILSDLEEAETALQSGRITPKGHVRAVIPFSFGRVTLIPELPRFFASFPEITLDLNFNDHPVDLIGEGYDLAVRTGHISDSRLVTRLLTKGALVTVASPKYLEKHGTPRTPDDLKDHNCIVGRFGPEWNFRAHGQKIKSTRVHGNVVIDSGDALREGAVAGIGVAQGTWWLFRKDLQRGAVKAILTKYAAEGPPISLLYTSNRHLPKKVRVFLDFLIAITKQH